eukprot:750719-Hanusia_phi.AAC.2
MDCTTQGEAEDDCSKGDSTRLEDFLTSSAMNLHDLTQSTTSESTLPASSQGGSQEHSQGENTETGLYSELLDAKLLGDEDQIRESISAILQSISQ